MEGSSDTGDAQGRGSCDSAPGGEAAWVSTRESAWLPKVEEGIIAGGGEAGLSKLIREENSPEEGGRADKRSSRCSGSIGSNNCREISWVRNSELIEPSWYRLPERVQIRRSELD